MGGRRLIGVSAIVCAGTLSLAEIEKNGELPSTRQWAALGIAFLILSIASDLGAEGFASGLALLLLLSVVLVRGDDVLRYLGIPTGIPKAGGVPVQSRGQPQQPILGGVARAAHR